MNVLNRPVLDRALAQCRGFMGAPITLVVLVERAILAFAEPSK